jgi:hypothetical protein
MKFTRNVNIIQDKYELWSIDDTTLGLILKRSKKNKKLNDLLKQYPADTTFLQDDEPLFKIKPHQASEVDSLTGLKLNVFVLKV